MFLGQTGTLVRQDLYLASWPDLAKISMLRLNIGSGMLRLSACMLSIGLGAKCEQGKGGHPSPLALNGFGSSANAEHA